MSAHRGLISTLPWLLLPSACDPLFVDPIDDGDISAGGPPLLEEGSCAGDTLAGSCEAPCDARLGFQRGDTTGLPPIATPCAASAAEVWSFYAPPHDGIPTPIFSVTVRSPGDVGIAILSSLDCSDDAVAGDVIAACRSITGPSEAELIEIDAPSDQVIYLVPFHVEGDGEYSLDVAIYGTGG